MPTRGHDGIFFSSPCKNLSFSVVESKLIRITGDFDAVSIWIEKADGPVAGDFQDFWTADDRNFASFEDWIERVHFLIAFNVNAEVMQFRHSLAARVFCARR